MPLPGNIGTITVTARYAPLGIPLAGDVVFRPNVPTLVDAAAPAFIIGSVVADLDASGSISQPLYLNDDAGLNPSGWLWEVTENIIGLPPRPPYLIRLTADMGPSVDLADPRLAQQNPPPPYSTVYGVLVNPNTWSGLNNFTGGLKVGGVLIAVPPGGTTRFLAADGTWQTPPSATVTSVNGQEGVVNLAAADVHAIATALATAKGDLAVASGANAFARLAVGADGTVLKANAAQPTGLEWGTVTSGGQTTIASSWVTAGAITFNADVAFTLYAGVEISIPAAVGDRIEFTAGAMWQKVGGDFIDWAVVVGGSMVRFSSSNTGTPCIEGDPGWYPDTGFARGSGSWDFVVASGDLDSGVVRVGLAHKGSAGGTFYSNANYPAKLSLKNFGPAP